MNRSAIIDQQCALIQERGVHDYRTAFDAIVAELNTNNLLADAEIIHKLVVSVSSASADNQKCFEGNLLDHQLYRIFRDSFLTILRLWRSGQVLDPSSSAILSGVSNMFAEMSLRASNTDVDPLRRLLVHQPLIAEIRDIVTEIATDGKHLQNSQIGAVDSMLRAIHHLEKGRVEIQNDPMLCTVLNAVVQCVCSTYFMAMFREAVEVQKFDEAQTLLLDTCTNHICWHDAGHYTEVCLAVQAALLSEFVRWLQDHAISYQRWSQAAIKVMGQLYITLISGNARDSDVFSQHVRADYCKMIDTFFTILDALMKSDTIDASTKALTKVLTQGLYSLTMTSDLRSYIISRHEVPLLLKLAAIEEETTQFNVYRILASIMTEDDIKTLANPSSIAHVFITFLTKLIDDSSMTPRFHNLLRSLKSLIQHDQIKEQLARQGAISLLIRCATEAKFDLVKAREPALEILLALTFNDDAALQLKQNSAFMSSLKTILSSSAEQSLQRPADSLIWKLEKEEMKIATGCSTHTYDIMLSYSHSDKDLCHRIHDRLVKDNFRVWLDRDYMHGGTMVAMANAIENSEFVLICMSDTYKQSAYCQSEAHYAFERRCHLIPLIVKANYRPDGWLGMIVTGKLYVNFQKLGFDHAYDKLTNEIDRYRKNGSHAIVSRIPLQHTALLKTTESEKIPERLYLDGSSSLVTEYPHCVTLWTKDHVRSFLINEKLDSLLPVLGNMNGRLLHETCRRCTMHWEVMFQTFKAEVAADRQHELLPIETYIRFLDEIEKFMPKEQVGSSKPSAICMLM